MNDKIKVNGVLYEAISPRRMSSDRRGKFNQIVYSEYNRGIDIEIISAKDVNKRYTNDPLFEFCFYKDHDSSMYSVGGRITDCESCDIYFADEDEINRQKVDKIFRFIIDFDAKLCRPWTLRDVNKLADKIESKFDYVLMDDYLEDMDHTWYDVREYDEYTYDDLVYGVLDGDDSPLIFFDTCPDYDRVMDEVQAERDDLAGLVSWDNRRISAGLR